MVGLASTPLAWEALGRGPRLLVADGPRSAGAQLADVLNDLRAVVRIAEDAGCRGLVDTTRYLPELLLLRTPQLAGQLVDRVFGALRRADRHDLERTLVALAEHGFERRATAAAVPVHRNTLTQRLARIAQLTGLDLDDPADRGVVWLAALARRHHLSSCSQRVGQPVVAPGARRPRSRSRSTPPDDLPDPGVASRARQLDESVAALALLDRLSERDRARLRSVA